MTAAGSYCLCVRCGDTSDHVYVLSYAFERDGVANSFDLCDRCMVESRSRIPRWCRVRSHEHFASPDCREPECVVRSVVES